MPARNHGASQKESPIYYEYQIWKALKRRCNNKNSDDFKDYGAKGIKVSKYWENDFNTFIKDMGPRPSKNYSLDRIDGSKGYNKSNCHWATPKEQATNKARVKMITFKGKSMHLTDWAKELKIRRSKLWMRIFRYNWAIDKALSVGV